MVLRRLSVASVFALLIALGIAVVGAQQCYQPSVIASSDPAPSTPTGLQATTTDGSLGVAVDWDDVDGAADYWVRWRAAGPGNVLNDGVRATSSNTSITVGGYGAWVVRVQACNNAGCGSPATSRFEVSSATEPTPEPTATPTPGPVPTPEPTPEPTATPTPEPIPTPEPRIDPPGQPTGLQVETKTGSLGVSVSWDDTQGATSYKVRWRVGGPGNELNEGLEVQSSNADITVAAYGEWVVRVEACNSAGCGPHSARAFEVEAAAGGPTPAPTATPTPAPTPTPTPDPIPTPTPDPTPIDAPGQPTGLQVETETGSLDVSVSWDDVASAQRHTRSAGEWVARATR